MVGEDDVPARRGQQRRIRSDALANQERVLAAAATAVLREGRHVPMATIAAEAGVGIGTLYRRYPSREALLEALTLRAFLLVLQFAEDAEDMDGSARASLSSFLDGVISHRDQLVLPMHGGPPPSAPATLAARSRVHQALGRLLDRGRSDGSIRADVTTRDIIVLGAMLAQLPDNPDGSQASLRLKAIFLDGLAGRPAGPPAWARRPGPAGSGATPAAGASHQPAGGAKVRSTPSSPAT